MPAIISLCARHNWQTTIAVCRRRQKEGIRPRFRSREYNSGISVPDRSPVCFRTTFIFGTQKKTWPKSQYIRRFALHKRVSGKSRWRFWYIARCRTPTRSEYFTELFSDGTCRRGMFTPKLSMWRFVGLTKNTARCFLIRAINCMELGRTIVTQLSMQRNAVEFKSIHWPK